MALLDNALTTVEQVKQFYPTIETNFTDPDIEFLINSISGFFERYCNRKFNQQQKVDTLTGNGKEKQFLKQYPITTINEVLLDGVDITTDVVADTIEDDLIEGAIYYEDCFISKRRGLKVDYVHGFITRPVAAQETDITLPYDVENLCLRLIMNIADDILSRNSDIEGGGSNGARTLKSFSITDVKWSFGGTGTNAANNKRGMIVDVESYLTPGDKVLLGGMKDYKL